MFIAVINENFSVAEEAKRSQQASLYFQTQEPDKTRAAWVHKLNPYRWFKPSPRAIVVETLPSNLVLPMQKSLVQDYKMPERRPSRVRFFPFPSSLPRRCFVLMISCVVPDSGERKARPQCREQVAQYIAATVHWRNPI
jgi:hypothetical protein